MLRDLAILSSVPLHALALPWRSPSVNAARLFAGEARRAFFEEGGHRFGMVGSLVRDGLERR